jgi:predicted amidophosphoribosyltransferase
MGRQLERPVVELLDRTRYTPPQSLMTPSERARSAKGSVGLKRVDLAGWWVWVVDDVKTTGSTLEACVRALHEGGPEGVSVAVGAVADPKALVV